MSTIDAALGWLERASDWLNPILVKETRQALKSRQFIFTFTLLLIAAWLISAFGMLSAGEAINYGSAGHAFFCFYFAILTTAIFVIVPYTAFRSLLTERDLNTYELLSITTLSPRRIVWGKVSTSMVQVLIYYSAIAPFIAFTSLLQGFDLSQVLFMLVCAALLSLAFCMFALMFGALARHRVWQALVSFLLLITLVWYQFFVYIMIFQGELAWIIAFDDPDFWIGMAMTIVFGASYILLAQEIAVAQLTFEAGNRSTGIRVIASSQFLLAWIALFSIEAWYGGLTSISVWDIMPLVILSTLHLAAIGILLVAEEDILSRRVRRTLPKTRPIRLLTIPFLPGGHRGFLYIVVHLVLMIAVCLGCVIYCGADAKLISLAVASACYLVIYLGLGLAIGRWARMVSSDYRPAHTRVVILLLFAIGQIAPLFPYMFGFMRWNDNSSFFVTNAFVTLGGMSGSSDRYAVSLVLLEIGAIVCLLINARAIVRSVLEVRPSDTDSPLPDAGTEETETFGRRQGSGLVKKPDTGELR